ncbi:hypothetical protein DFH08DRAFT_804172 [Mycena albidolilacea]|uniref:Uncharacterized protein n=1 Tax=Mycena albidolilacea TaxID=1033008 RepID=A0AAD7EWS5_9AGAR|nr:hypothetical protein DFH08DRAFT_804172 [Mycena albidolilacea]
MNKERETGGRPEVQMVQWMGLRFGRGCRGWNPEDRRQGGGRGLAKEASEPDGPDGACTDTGRKGHPRVQGMGEDWQPRGPDEDKTKDCLTSWIPLVGRIRTRGLAKKADKPNGAHTDIEWMEVMQMEWIDDR